MIPMSELFPRVHDILWRMLRPMHYRDLTKQALEELDYPESELYRAKEDVREKLLEAGQRGLGYFGRPHCLGYAKAWFEKTTPGFFNETHEGIVLPVSASAAKDAGKELAMRKDFLRTKHADSERRWEGASRGFVIEKIVSDYFRREFPEQFKGPDNEGKWESYCNHDFKLLVNGIWCEFDVAGPDGEGRFGNVTSKPKCPFHLIAEFTDDGWSVILRGWKKGADFCQQKFSSWETLPICRLVVSLNCEKYRIPIEIN